MLTDEMDLRGERTPEYGIATGRLSARGRRFCPSMRRVMMVAAGAALLVVTACSSGESASTTSSATTTSTSAAPTTSTTTVQTTVATTTPPTTTPPTTAPNVDDELMAAVERAVKATKDCYLAGPEPCDEQQLEDAFVGYPLEVWQNLSAESVAEGRYREKVDELKWVIESGPTLKGEDLAIVTVCWNDPIVVYASDGSVINDDVVSMREEWQLFPVGDTWKLGIVNRFEETIDEDLCS